MVKQSVWIGIAIGVFFAGLGIGYGVFQSAQSSFMPMTTQQMQQMMSNPQAMNSWMNNMMDNNQLRQQMFEYMVQNPEQMRQWMIQDPRHIDLMSQAMKENHEFMQEMMLDIINDPQLRLQMLGHMTENQEVMQQMRELTQTGNMTRGPMMGQHP